MLGYNFVNSCYLAATTLGRKYSLIQVEIGCVASL